MREGESLEKLAPVIERSIPSLIVALQHLVFCQAGPTKIYITIHQNTGNTGAKAANR